MPGFERVGQQFQGSGRELVKTICDCARLVKLFTYVSQTRVSTDKDCVISEQHRSKTRPDEYNFDKYANHPVELPLVSFRPQYIYGYEQERITLTGI
jgi:hypothetical protein